ncbi:hypothetical protein TBLA_0A01480 [Henningerozyma blattae CBS 6284]|uniref:Actin-related protein 2/3 complex subunit n=1 Tax=Henningerozyma blattae (strain ATCC 34711 / CBS 6284 / DSM 70876 / NBRC 10599 / NRRL Y-10934 / UCD 77-7) TaxID=1071380 RepID=I2GUZ5_HENB6|nr:hypothetical protein TBLA_0A01480 [Tetrapisispora blattae CBS 6284]CCH57947.1 hypothetical protein TBLA_0A01480 [Tetrapisispora blattae CBS 6284]
MSSDKSIVASFKLVKGPIYSHCFNADRTILAITSDTNCLVYRMNGTKKPILHATLNNHDKTVTAVDISIHGRIVTCSQDRNAYVWEPLSNGTYKPTLVLLRINRAATCVSWAPNGYKFAVGSSARIIAVCYYEQENNWWVSKHIKKPIKSTVNCVAWHDNGIILAAGGTDGVARVFSGFIKGLDSKDAVVNSPWGAKFPFGFLLKEFYEGSYINDIKWRCNLEQLAFVTHDGALNVVDSQNYYAQVDSPEGLPYRALTWINDSSILTAGYNCHPVLFKFNGSNWAFAKNFDKVANTASVGASKKAGPPVVPQKPKSFNTNDDNDEEPQSFGISALKKFKELDLKGTVTTNKVEKGAHDNAISELAVFYESNGNVTQVSSCGLDGEIVIYSI